MTLRARLTWATAVAVALAVGAVAVVVYLLVGGQLRAEVDRSLQQRITAIQRLAREGAPPPPAAGDGQEVPADYTREALAEPGAFVQLVYADGHVIRPAGEEGDDLPVSEHARAVAAGRSPAFVAEAHVEDVHLLVRTAPLAAGVAVQVTRPLTETDRTQQRIGWLLAVASGVAFVAAGALGRAVARAALAPVGRLTATAEHIATSRDLGHRIRVTGSDELSRLAASFNAMLAALEQSVAAQRQLVADASHELRTPMTSLRTNVEVLDQVERLSPEDRRRLLADVREQIDELNDLVGDVVDLARGDVSPGIAVEARVDELVAAAVDRARRHWPAVSFRADLAAAVGVVVPDRLDRAVSNLLDNAAKWSPPGGPVEVAVRAGDGTVEVTVRDHGEGIDPADAPHVFDRFYRADTARGLPGSGLGLAIVKQVADAHCGTVALEPAPGGGTLARLVLHANP